MTSRESKATTPLRQPFYNLEWPDRAVPLASVPGIANGDLHLVIGRAPGGVVRLPTWKPLAMVSSGELVDYQPSYLGAPLCSDRMRQLIDENKGPNDVIEWLPVTVNGQPYWVLNFPERADVLDEAKTLAFDGDVAKPVLKHDRLDGRHVFSYPGGGRLAVVVSKRMKNLLEKSCTFIEFSKIEVV